MGKKETTLTQEEKEFFMREAIAEAKKAEGLAEVPIGAVIVRQGEIIGRGHNLREARQEATAHAEMYAIQEACRGIENWRLEETQLFVTLEPCPMCSGAMLLARIPEVYYGATDPKAGTAGTLMNLLEDERFNHVAYVEAGVLEEECRLLLVQFFKKLREKKKEEKLLKNQKKD
ncbi:tRNA adenosine(34) deaminase TadA [Enterococcus faecalis]|uniref:tRNA adenosine(34) deaminase TadA n=1 Tax=Enterococcus faecalis TaxID=1351 RepID=UPI001CD76085|nr:tRNA adenosine(34) deaminase TadA [Enterococcus faecalis]